MFGKNKKECKIELNNTYAVKGWSNCFMAPIITMVPNLQIHKHGDCYINALITHIKCNKSVAVTEFVKKQLVEANKLDETFVNTSTHTSFDFLIVVSNKFKRLPRKQQLALLVLETVRAGGIEMNVDVNFNDASDVEICKEIEAIIKATDMFGKRTVSKAVDKARNVTDKSCFKASSHKFFQRAPKEAYTSCTSNAAEKPVGEESDKKSETAKEPEESDKKSENNTKSNNKAAAGATT